MAESLDFRPKAMMGITVSDCQVIAVHKQGLLAFLGVVEGAQQFYGPRSTLGFGGFRKFR